MNCIPRYDYPLPRPCPFPEPFPRPRDPYQRPYPPFLGPRNPRTWWQNSVILFEMDI